MMPSGVHESMTCAHAHATHNRVRRYKGTHALHHHTTHLVRAETHAQHWPRPRPMPMHAHTHRAHATRQLGQRVAGGHVPGALVQWAVNAPRVRTVHQSVVQQRVEDGLDVLLPKRRVGDGPCQRCAVQPRNNAHQVHAGLMDRGTGVAPRNTATRGGGGGGGQHPPKRAPRGWREDMHTPQPPLPHATPRVQTQPTTLAWAGAQDHSHTPHDNSCERAHTRVHTREGVGLWGRTTPGARRARAGGGVRGRAGACAGGCARVRGDADTRADTVPSGCPSARPAPSTGCRPQSRGQAPGAPCTTGRR